jgi:hypothetical protein
MIQPSTNLVRWIPIYANLPAFGQIKLTNSMTNSLTRFYEAVILPPP